MRIKNKIKKPLAEINDFLRSKKKPGLKSIHLLRLDVKHLAAYLELMAFEKGLGTGTEIPDRLRRLFERAGEMRKYELEISSMESIAKTSGLAKPSQFIKQLQFSEKKTGKKLVRDRSRFRRFKMRDFASHPNSKLSSGVWRRFMAARASAILELMNKDILSDIRDLHQLRKVLKSIIYVMPLCKWGARPVREYLNSQKDFMKSIESKIGSVHDTGSFISRLNKKNNLIQVKERNSLEMIKSEWQNDIKKMKQDFIQLLPAIRQFATDLKGKAGIQLEIAILPVRKKKVK